MQSRSVARKTERPTEADREAWQLTVNNAPHRAVHTIPTTQRRAKTCVHGGRGARLAEAAYRDNRLAHVPMWVIRAIQKMKKDVTTPIFG